MLYVRSEDVFRLHTVVLYALTCIAQFTPSHTLPVIPFHSMYSTSFQILYTSEVLQYFSLYVWIYFTWHDVLWVHQHCHKWQDLFLKTEQHFIMCTTMSLSTHTLQIFYVHILATVNNDAMNIGVCISYGVQILILLFLYPEKGVELYTSTFLFTFVNEVHISYAPMLFRVLSFQFDTFSLAFLVLQVYR